MMQPQTGRHPPPCWLARATPAEAPVLAELHAACFPQAWQAGEFNSFFAQGNVLAWLARREQAAIGFIFGWQVAEQCELLALGVLPEVRRTGVARQLLQQLLAAVQTRGLNRVFLEVGVRNAAARALYQALGFNVIGRRKDYYHYPDGRVEDAVTMAWEKG